MKQLLHSGFGMSGIIKVSISVMNLGLNRDYLMVGERVRFLFTNCEGSLTHSLVPRSFVCDSSQNVNKNRTNEPTYHEVIRGRMEKPESGTGAGNGNRTGTGTGTGTRT